MFAINSLIVTVSYAMPNAITLDIEGIDRQDDADGQYRCVSAETGAFVVVTLTRGEGRQVTNMYLLSKK